jgi:hypothetical protein
MQMSEISLNGLSDRRDDIFHRSERMKNGGSVSGFVIIGSQRENWDAGAEGRMSNASSWISGGQGFPTKI